MIWIRFEPDPLKSDYFQKGYGMRKWILDSKGMGLIEFLLWASLLALLGWAVWQLYQHPESLNPKPEGHHPYEDTTH